jgi:perosamine synthetase
MFRHVAPAGAPIGALDLLQWVSVTVTRPDAAAALIAAIQARFNVRHAYLTSTGRAGMTLLLRALRRLAPATRDEVILPSYTCYSVAASVVKAGLKVRIVDIDHRTLGYASAELDAADFSRVLAIVATNLYGLPDDLPGLAALARARGTFLIDDAAQAMGASVGGRPSGTWGDAGLFSFDKGKNVSAIDGGVVVTSSNDVAAALAEECKPLSSPGAVNAAVLAAKALVYSALLRPQLYWMPNRIPQLELGRTVFTTDFSLGAQSRVQSALALTMLRRLDGFTQARTHNARLFLEGIGSSTRVRSVAPSPGSSPVYLRLPLLAPDEATRDGLLARLNAAGIGATGSYPRSLADVDELTDYRPARRAIVGSDVSRRILTLPTHPFVERYDVERAVAILMADVASSPPQGSRTA